jgi:hypothetical protein
MACSRHFFAIIGGNLWHRDRMSFLRLTTLVAGALACTGCFQMTTVMKLQGDGSGTIEHRMLFTAKALQQLKQFSMLGGGGGQAVDPTSEQQAREMASALGPGVTYVTSTPVSTPTGQGRDAVYAFSDVGQLRVAAQPATPGGATIRAQGLSSDAESVTFSLSHETNGNAVLHILVPQPALVEAMSSSSVTPQQIAMAKTMLAGARIALTVEPAGTLVQTTSPFVEGQRVTLLDIDLDQVLKDETLIAKLQAAKTPDEIKAAVREVPGLKVSLEREITIEFTPAR